MRYHWGLWVGHLYSHEPKAGHQPSNPTLADHEDDPQALDSSFTDERNSAGPSNPVKLKDIDNSESDSDKSETDSLSDLNLSDLLDLSDLFKEDEELEAELYDMFGDDDHGIDITSYD